MLKAYVCISKAAPRPEEPEPRVKTFTPSVVDVASGNVNYAAVVAGNSHETASVKRSAASTNPRVSAGTSQTPNAAGNLGTVGGR